MPEFTPEYLKANPLPPRHKRAVVFAVRYFPVIATLPVIVMAAVFIHNTAIASGVGAVLLLVSTALGDMWKKKLVSMGLMDVLNRWVSET